MCSTPHQHSVFRNSRERATDFVFYGCLAAFERVNSEPPLGPKAPDLLFRYSLTDRHVGFTFPFSFFAAKACLAARLVVVKKAVARCLGDATKSERGEEMVRSQSYQSTAGRGEADLAETTDVMEVETTAIVGAPRILQRFYAGPRDLHLLVFKQLASQDGAGGYLARVMQVCRQWRNLLTGTTRPSSDSSRYQHRGDWIRGVLCFLPQS